MQGIGGTSWYMEEWFRAVALSTIELVKIFTAHL